MLGLKNKKDPYSREYRKKLGFTSEAKVKRFFGAKDIPAVIDFGFIESLNKRLYEMVDRMNSAVTKEIFATKPEAFKREFIDRPFSIMKNNGVLPRLNNQGRRPEKVYFDWMRGYVIQNFFAKAIDIIFEVDTRRRILIGDDDFKKLETFKRTPKADLELVLNSGEKLRLEVQAGFTGVNDIKKHKVVQANKVFSDSGVHTVAVHFDLYDGKAAFLRLDGIDEKHLGWESRSQMEGQTVLSISKDQFIWKMTDDPIKYKDMKL